MSERTKIPAPVRMVSLLARDCLTDEMIIQALLAWYRRQEQEEFDRETDRATDLLIDSQMQPGIMAYILGVHAGTREDVEALVGVLRGGFLAKEDSEREEQAKRELAKVN